MELYHGSNIKVTEPKILASLRALDFGAGFYLTSNREQASQWARIVTKRRRSGRATLNIYEINESCFATVNVLRFEVADGAWLEFVVSNRKEQITEYFYDLVIGPVANDSTLLIIDDYMDGVYTKEEAVKRLLPQNLTDQYAFLADRALKLLSFVRSEPI